MVIDKGTEILWQTENHRKPNFEDDYEELKQKRLQLLKAVTSENDDSNDSLNNDFIDEAVVEDVEEEPHAEEEELETQEIQQQNYQRHLLRQQQLHRHHYRYLEDVDDAEPDGQESLQSVESEQHDHLLQQ
ncbi:hypothetical protein EVAR_72743_1 [Eumeta japonica]|uniref:Uncharacterized protein n=1 Tax=Eumeta variegata TaxID=151549 RepID=A0A4C1SED1_EUMVA|nr:hypothetical protein EVAR_72743_1 [Eumeta japonica]